MPLPASIMSLLTSPGLRHARRTLGSLRRRIARQRATVHFFYQVDDPYSQLLLDALPELIERYRVDLVLHLVGPPDDAAVPDRERLRDWSRRDAAELALAIQRTQPSHAPEIAVSPAPTCGPFAALPSPDSTAAAEQAMAALIDARPDLPTLLAGAQAIRTECWCSKLAALQTRPCAGRAGTDALMRRGRAQRTAFGHYLSGTLYFEHEWYWGIDRLHYLERRLFALQDGQQRAFAPLRPFPALLSSPRNTLPVASLASVAPVASVARPPVLNFFCSLRSPYSYLAIDRCAALAEHYGAELRLRFVLPMVMRGLPVPREKQLYIVLDAKREAETLGLAFGRIADPVGAPTERGLAVLHRAMGIGRGLAFLRSFMRGVWAEGINAGTYKGLQMLAMRAGLDAQFVAAALADDSWRAVATANRDEMLATGLWGVPSFRVNDGVARWGQDRLWLVEDDLRRAQHTATD